ncbi:MAG: DUF2226 domain-containing protein [bacterium]|nr:DUF2226 domain-containing protein [bacterium]
MDFPKGLIIKENLEISSPKDSLQDVLDKNFTGYVALDVLGYGGVEEALLVINGGKIIMAEYIHFRFGKRLEADSALPYVLNLLAADRALLNIVALDVREMDFVLELNERYRLSRPLDIYRLPKLAPARYDPSLEKSLEQEIIEIARQRKEYGKLAPLGKILLETKDKEQIIKRLRINYEKIRTDAERFVLVLKGMTPEEQDTKLAEKMKNELSKLECIEVKQVVCKVDKAAKKLKFELHFILYTSKLVAPISNEEILKQVIEQLAKAVVEEEGQQYKDLNIEIKYNIERVE